MYNLQHIIFRSLFYIGLLSPFVFIACCVIICSSQYLKQKSKKNKEINNLEKKYRKQNQSNYATYSDTSGSSTQSLWIEVENPNEHSIQSDENHSKRNSSRNSVKTSFVNLTGGRHFKYSDSMLLLPKTGSYENTSENEIHINPDHLSQKKIMAPKFAMGHIYSKHGDTQENMYNDNPTKCTCNKKPYTTQSKVKIQDRFTGDMKFDNASLSIDPVALVKKISGRTDKLYDEELRTTSLKNASKNDRESETNISNEKFQQYGFGDDQVCPPEETNEFSQFNTNEKCPFCTISKENNLVSERHKTECVPQNSYNPQRNNKHHRDSRNSVFQNRNIPIAKKVLEDDQFYDLRQKFYDAENTFQNASSNPKKYEPSFVTLNKNKQTYQFDEKLHAQKMRHLAEESIRDSCVQHAAQSANVIIEETENENQTANSPSTCNSSGKEELLFQFWKSLKTETVGQKRNKSIQTEVPRIEQNNGELFSEKHATDSNDYYKKKFQEVMSHIESKQDVMKQEQNTTAKKSVLNSTQNESTQTYLNEKQCIQKKLSQSQDMECPQIQPFSIQMPGDIRTIENKMCRNCQILLPPADYSKKKEIKPMTLYSKPTMMQTEFEHTCLEPLQPDNTQLIENTEHYQCSDNCYLRPNLSMKYENICDRCNGDNCSQNKNNYVCNPIMLLNHFENRQSLNPNYNARQNKSQKMHFEYGNMPLNNPCINTAQCGQYDKYKHTIPIMEKETNYRNEYAHQQRSNRIHCEPFNIMPAAEDPYNTNTKKFYNQPRTTRHDKNTISQENEFYDKHRYMQNEDTHHNYKNSKSQTHNTIETDMKATQTSEEPALLSSSHEKHCNKQLAKEKVNKSNSKIEIGKQVLEKSTADQSHLKQTVEKMRIIKRMYPQIDQNIHETNKNVINEVKSVLQKTGKWQSEDN